MLLHQAKVTNTYKIHSDPANFVSYLRFGYYEPITVTLYHLAFSQKLFARAVAALGGPLKAFSDDLSIVSL